LVLRMERKKWKYIDLPWATKRAISFSN
jgi:hypothetical protein